MVEQTIIDEKIQYGYELLAQKETSKACDAWLEAWEGLKELLTEKNISSVENINLLYDWSEFPSNYVQDFEMELGNAGVDNLEYNRKRITYCTELLLYAGDDEKMISNTRCAIADSYFELGDNVECDRLYNQWLKEDPKWGWGYIGWFRQYENHYHKRHDIAKATSIIERALGVEDARDRLDIVDAALEFYEENNGDAEKISVLRKEFALLKSADPSRWTMHKPIPVAVNKVGRNDPCPCGSGKKYKNCHGKVGA
jgi:tetratricopeptide (TPR) repeat protein